MLCSLGLAALAGVLPATAQQPYGAGARTSRPASTFATPYPSLPAPGPVPTWADQQQQQQQVQTAGFQNPLIQTGFVNPALQSRVEGGLTQSAYTAPKAQPSAKPPGTRSAPGADGKVMYFHKSENSLVPDGQADDGAVAMASDKPISAPVSDVPVRTPGTLPATPAPTSTIEKPIFEPVSEPLLPPQPFIPTSPSPLPKEAISAQPVPPRVVPVPTQPSTPGAAIVPDDIPPRQYIFQMYDDATLEDIIRRSIMERLNKAPDAKRTWKIEEMIRLPEVKPTVPPGTPYAAKTLHLPPGQMVFEPGFVIHRRLHFEEKNAERQGWDLGIVQPFVSTMSFYKNMLLWPNSLATGVVVGTWDTNAGKCLPGSPTPLYLYPQGLSITGLTVEGALITGLTFVIP